MKKVQILTNQNKIYSEVTTSASYANECGEFSIRMVIDGHEQYKLGNKNLKVFPGNFLVINEGTVFAREIYSEIPVNTISISYNRQFLNSFHHSATSSDSALLEDPFYTPQGLVPVFLETLYPLKGDMRFNLMHLHNLVNSESQEDMLVNQYLIHSLINFYRIYNKEIVAKCDTLKAMSYKTRTELFKRLNIAKDYMISNYNQPVSLSDICGNACLSQTHFCRTFKQTFHCSPYQYLIQVRLSRAKHMLKHTRYEVNEIVNMIGIDNVSSFIRFFKGRYGITPGAYRASVAA
ncbi:MAG: helix-turn-helix domain-containing protein [Mucilaginibacter sp.]